MTNSTQPSPALDAFHVLLKPRGAICNLDCKYCFFLSKEKLFPGSKFRMSDEMLEDYTRQHIEAHNVQEVTFAWQGGEPTLMGLDFFRLAVELQDKYRKPGTRILNTLQTNATTLNDDWCGFFKQHDFLLGISIDGPQALHDAYRVDKGGSPTWHRVMQGIEFARKHGVEFNVLTTVHAANAAHGRAVYRFLRDEVGASFIQFIPIIERDNETGFQEGNTVTDRSVTGEQYGTFLIEVFDEWVRKDVGKMFVQLFDVALGVWMGHPSALCVFAETCGGALALEHNGDLYSCDHFVEPRFRLGNVAETPLAEMVSSPRQQKFGADKRDTLPRYCQECEVRFICNGGCPKDRILETPDGEPGLNYLCAGFRPFFNHINPFMQVMAGLISNRRSPAEIMDMLLDQPSSGQ